MPDSEVVQLSHGNGSERSGLRIFVSYRRGDAPDSAGLLRERLVAAGYCPENVFIDVQQKAGVKFPEEIMRAIDAADVFIAVVGPRWLEIQDKDGRRRLDDPEDWTRREIEMALARGMTVIPVCVGGAEMPAPDEVPPSLAEFAETHGMVISHDRGVQDTQALVGRLAELANEAANVRISNLREADARFVGREALLGDIEASLSGQQMSIVAIVGFPGIGKTKLAFEYAHRHHDDYRIVWEVPAEQRTTCRERFGALSRQLRLSPRHDQDLVEAVRTALERTEGWLLIFDNAKGVAGVRDLIPRHGGHVLITSQRASWAELDARTVNVEAMTTEDAAALLRDRCPEASEAELARLAEALLRIPLALEQAAAYMRERHMPVSVYMDLFEAQSHEILKRGEIRDYDRTVMSTWELAFDEVEERAARQAPGAVELLNLCAYLAPDSIPLDAFADHADALPEPAATVVRDKLAGADAVGLLADYRHLTWARDGTLDLHRMVQHFARERLDSESKRTWCGAAVAVVLAAFPEDPTDVASWQACTALLPHATAALDQAEKLGVDEQSRAKLLDRVGVSLASGAQFAAARKAFGSALRLFDGLNGARQADAATVRNHLGNLLRELGDLDGAYTNLAAALAVHEAVCGPESLEVADDRLNLARVLADRDDLAGSRVQLEAALRIHTDLLGRNHRAVAEDLSVLFNQSLRSGNVLDARDHLRSAIAVYEALGQLDHPEAVFFRFVDNHLFGDDDDVTGASTRLEGVLEVSVQAYGKDHPEVAEWRQWLADAQLREGNVESAEKNYARALEIDQKAYGAQHWKLARDLLRLFVIQAARGQETEARENLDRAIEVLQRVSRTRGRDGDAHGIGGSLFVLAKFDEALSSLGVLTAVVAPFDRICQLVQDAWGEDTPLMASALEHLAAELHEAGGPDNLGRAERLVTRALAIFAAHYGSDQPRVAQCRARLGAVQAALGKTDEARASYEEALRILDEVELPNQLELITVLTGLYPLLVASEKRAAMEATENRQTEQPIQAAQSRGGEPRAYTATGINERIQDLATRAVGVGPLIGLGEALAAAGQLEQSAAIYEKVAKMLAETYGNERPIVAVSLRRLGTLYLMLGDDAAGLARHEQALQIDLAHFGSEHETVAKDLVSISHALAGLGDAEAAAGNLTRGLAIIERSLADDDDGLARLRVEHWVSVGDAATDMEVARTLYERGSTRVRGAAGEATIRARLGGLAAAAGNLAGALEHVRAAAELQIAAGAADPFWAVLRDATPGARRSKEWRQFDHALRILREEPSMQEHERTFQPEIVAVVPDGWHTKESMTILAPDGQANVIASGEPLDPSIDSQQYAEIQGGLLAGGEFPEYDELAFEEVELLGGRRGFIRHFEWTPPDGVRVTQVQLYHANDGRGYTATATTPTTNFERVGAELRQMLFGLRIGT